MTVSDSNGCDAWDEFELQAPNQRNLRPGQARRRDELSLPDLRDPMTALAGYRSTGKPQFALIAIGGFLERGEPLYDDLREFALRLSPVFIEASNKRQTAESCQQVVADALLGASMTAQEGRSRKLKRTGGKGTLKDAFSAGFTFLRDQAIVAAVDDLVMRREATYPKAKRSIQTKKQMFEAVAKEHGVNKSDVRRVYYRDRVTEFSIEPCFPVIGAPQNGSSRQTG